MFNTFKESEIQTNKIDSNIKKPHITFFIIS